MKTRWLAALSVVAMVVALSFPVLAQTEGVPSCPFTEGYIVDLGGQMIRSDMTDAEAATAPVAVDIPAGTYDVWLFSYDPHDGGSPQSQANEQFYVTDGEWRSGSISDLPDEVDTLSQQVDIGVEVPRLTSLWAFHAAYPTTGDPYTYANSIHPICAAFVAAATTTTTEATTTTTEATTTTTEATTTTTEATTTTTVPPTTTTTVPPTTTTTEATTTTVQVLETTVTNDPTSETLPFTGSDSEGFGGMAVALLASGAILILISRREASE